MPGPIQPTAPVRPGELLQAAARHEAELGGAVGDADLAADLRARLRGHARGQRAAADLDELHGAERAGFRRKRLQHAAELRGRGGEVVDAVERDRHRHVVPGNRRGHHAAGPQRAQHQRHAVVELHADGADLARMVGRAVAAPLVLDARVHQVVAERGRLRGAGGARGAHDHAVRLAARMHGHGRHPRRGGRGGRLPPAFVDDGGAGNAGPGNGVGERGVELHAAHAQRDLARGHRGRADARQRQHEQQLREVGGQHRAGDATRPEAQAEQARGERVDEGVELRVGEHPAEVEDGRLVRDGARVLANRIADVHRGILTGLSRAARP
jgi:hypothetical protein